MGKNLQAFYKHFYIGCLKTQQELDSVNGTTKNIYTVYIFFLFGQGASLAEAKVDVCTMVRVCWLV